MAITDRGTFIAAKVFISPDGAAWTDVSAHGASVAVDGGERMVEGQHVFDKDVPYVSAGKRQIQGLTIRYVWTSTDSDPFDVCRTAHETAPGTFYVQYNPLASGVWYKTGAGILVKPGYPGGEAGSAATIMSELVMKCAELTEADAST